MPSLLFGAELFTLTPGLLLKLECSQSWFLKHLFHVPSSIASEIAIKKLLFLGRLITERNMAPTGRNLLESRTESYFDTNITSVSVMLSISEVLVKYDLFQYFESWFKNSTFLIYTDWKRIVRSKSLKGTHGLSFATLMQTCMLLRLFRKICLSKNFGP